MRLRQLRAGCPREAPGNTIDKGKAGPGLLAHILTSKYCDHLPIYRQSQMYEREGIELARSTMTGWASQCALLILPVIDELKNQYLAPIIFMETILQLKY